MSFPWSGYAVWNVALFFSVVMTPNHLILCEWWAFMFAYMNPFDLGDAVQQSPFLVQTALISDGSSRDRQRQRLP